ncbi:DUF3224 domain-containing protein [Nocardia sp. NPDC052566]|uniref:DUF3224 domain-containing protein n=1 Tax=Nocardia sp. NPDC052566 TaxID=3364330 RepID=UPI0037CC8AFB
MKAIGTFPAGPFVPTDVVADPTITTALPVNVATVAKEYQGEITGRSATVFTSAFDQQAGVGTYIAMESFDGALNGRSGTFNFAHSATIAGSDRSNEFFLIVPSSGTGDLTGITGTGGMTVAADGTHTVWFDYELP